MKIQGFIFNWKGHESRAVALEQKIARLIDVTVINSEERLSSTHLGWVHLDDSAYFSAQWNKAMELFDADMLFHIQADMEFDKFDELFARVRTLAEKYRLGAYEPDFAGERAFRHDRSRLQELAPNVFEIPMTDSSCWFIAGEVIRNFPTVDLSVNRYGWGIPAAIAASCRLNGYSCVRDYSFVVKHIGGTGYASAVAEEERIRYIENLSGEMREEVLASYELHRSLRVPRGASCKRLRSLLLRASSFLRR